jgi:hypothetical protein
MRKRRAKPPIKEDLGRAVSAAEAAARAAPRQVLSDEEKARLAAEASRTEDA